MLFLWKEIRKLPPAVKKLVHPMRRRLGLDASLPQSLSSQSYRIFCVTNMIRSANPQLERSQAKPGPPLPTPLREQDTTRSGPEKIIPTAPAGMAEHHSQRPQARLRKTMSPCTPKFSQEHKPNLCPTPVIPHPLPATIITHIYIHTHFKNGI